MSLSGKFIPKFSSLHCFTPCIAIIFIFFITNKAFCQSQPIPPVDTSANPIDTIVVKGSSKASDSIRKDTIVLSLTDSLKKDSLAALTDTAKRKMLERSLGIRISKDALPSVVKAEAMDSAVLDMQHNLFYLYGKAKVNYEDLELNAGQVTYQQATNIITAAPYAAGKDTSGYKQTFTQGKEKLIYDSLQYNFKSKRAIVRNVHSQYGEGFVFSEQVKRNPDQTIFGWHSVYTTCALDTPHFGISAKKIKVIPGHVIVSGPANINIEGVPTPIWLPFGLFPVSDKQKSGFLLPTYTIEEQRGLGLLNGGYYLYLNDHVDVLTQANIYTKGSYAVSGATDYSYIYHYGGQFRFSYAYNKTGEDFEPTASITKDWMINWAHHSDAKAIPGQSFNASVEAGSSSFYSNNSYDANKILQNQYSSNITYAKNWQGTPLGLTISALHNQNTLSKQVNVTIPSINFHVTQINPFQKKKSVGTHWYDKITASYTFDVENRTTFYDSTLNLNKLALNDFQSGVHHSVPISASYTIFRYINMSFSVNYNEYWYKEKLYQRWDTTDKKIDSTDMRGFYAARDFNAGVNFSTRIYGMKLFKTGKLRGIRHVITPNVGFTYHPDFGASPYNYYYRTHLDSSTNPLTQTYLSPYATSIVGVPPLGKVGSVNFGINNNLQIKVRSSKDTVTGFKNVTLIDALGANISYNPAVDSFRWSNIALNFRTNIADKINISSSATFDPYAFDYDQGRRLSETMEDKGFGLARFTNAQLSLGSNFHSKPKGGGPNPTNSEEYGRIMRNAGYNDYVDFNIPWSYNFSYSLSADKSYNIVSKRDTTIFSQTLTLQGELQITTRWKVTCNTGFNFTLHQLTLTSIDVYRDLHCWQMHFQTVPFGPRKSFSFTLNVKSTVLQDLKLIRRRDYRDSPN
jgi:lipopolysaccharide assembly outer membrane protein LptD (OstA)